MWSRSTAHEGRQQREARRRAVAGIEGRVLEIGFGVGTNWQYLPASVDRYVGIEPDRYMLQRAKVIPAPLAVRGGLVRARAQELPFAAGTFDVVFATLTFCTIEDVPQALAEIRRVLKPGGSFHFWEHVRPDGRVIGRLADVVTPLWRRFGGGCHPNRRTVRAIEDAGFRIESLRRMNLGLVPMVIGSAKAGSGVAVPILDPA